MSHSSEVKKKSFSESMQGLKGPMYSQPEASYGAVFWLAAGLSQVAGFTIIGLIVYWCKLYGGFSWSDAGLQFYWHPLLMVLGLVFFYGDAIILFRVLSFLPKWILKILHASLHLCAIASSSVGLIAVLENHRRTNKADFFSVHSWVGIATFGFFCLQYIGGFLSFLFPGLPAPLRGTIMPFHVFFGIGIFAMAIGSAEMGLTEKLLWTTNYTEGTNTSEGTIGNIIGLLLIIFAFLIIFIATKAGYKRRPLANEIPSAAINTA